MEKGYVQVYTGDGKGKTTAAFGLALRAICAGKKVFIGQFIKGMEYSELKAVNYLPGLEIEQFGRDCFINNDPKSEDFKRAIEGFDKVKKILKEGKYDVVILDELNVATFYELIDVDEVLEVLETRAEHVEVIITGRYADKRILDYADLATEMREIKHYYRQGVQARVGIEK